MKLCQRCKKERPLEYFSKAASKLDGLQGICKGCHSVYIKEWSQKNRDKLREYNREYRKKDSVIKYQKKWAEENKERKRETDRASYLLRRDRQLARQKIYKREKYQSNVEYKISCVLRARLTAALISQGVNKTGSAIRDLGCTAAELKAHLERLWQPGMTWDNHSPTGWHIDHIKGMASFDLRDPEQQKLVNHFTNLQPLWAFDNIQKG